MPARSLKAQELVPFAEVDGELISEHYIPDHGKFCRKIYGGYTLIWDYLLSEQIGFFIIDNWRVVIGLAILVLLIAGVFTYRGCRSA